MSNTLLNELDYLFYTYSEAVYAVVHRVHGFFFIVFLFVFFFVFVFFANVVAKVIGVDESLEALLFSTLPFQIPLKYILTLLYLILKSLKCIIISLTKTTEFLQQFRPLLWMLLYFWQVVPHVFVKGVHYTLFAATFILKSIVHTIIFFH